MPPSKWRHFLRPSVCAYLVAIYIIGVLASGVFAVAHIAGIVSATLLCLASITVNHYFDREYDKKSKQLYRFPVADGSISPNFAFGLSALLMLVPVLLALSFLDLNSFYLILFGIFVVLAYSMPPIRMKERPLLGLIWNGLGYGLLPYYLALFVSDISITSDMHLFSLVPFLVAMSGHVLLQIRDIKDDKKAKVKTTSTVLGGLPALKLAKVMPALAGLIVLYLAVIEFLNPLAYLSVIAGAFAVFEYRRMKREGV
ncbi:MAG: UbiA prenyltransferase family protein, partial [Candidatus Aenigmarchaeota archaeon]|nr:UbiA prenyltransferase family protein [Candidatus Aenigmarchaeota archaeon]